jgi:hypothetical protein
MAAVVLSQPALTKVALPSMVSNAVARHRITIPTGVSISL